MHSQTHTTASSRSANGMLTYGYRSDVGRKREHNEDSSLVLNRSDLNDRFDGLFVVSDGMGGVGGGDVASRIVAQSLLATLRDILPKRPSGRIDLGLLLRDGLGRANREVQTRRARSAELRHMGATCVAIAVDGGQVTIANVGDSRAYLLRNGKLLQLTEDHSSVQEQVRAGMMTRDEAQQSRYRNVITRAVGIAPEIRPDLFAHDLAAGDALLLCSDGLTVEVAEAEIARILAAEADPQAACDRLVAAALSAGGSDNITVVALRYGPFTPLGPSDLDAEDDDTDPDADWRQAPTWDDREPRYDDDIAEADPEAALIAARQLTALRVGLCLLLCLAVAEGVAIGMLWRAAHRPQPGHTATVAQKPSLPTDAALDYPAAPRSIAPGPLREDVLQITPDGSALVATLSGIIEIVTPGGTLKPVPSNYDLRVPAPPTRLFGRGRSSDLTPRLDLTLDASGNRYQIAPGSRSIDKYDSQGEPIRSNIGRGALRAPTRLAVDRQGDIYVIDGRQLKRFDAQPVISSASPRTTSASAPLDTAR